MHKLYNWREIESSLGNLTFVVEITIDKIRLMKDIPQRSLLYFKPRGFLIKSLPIESVDPVDPSNILLIKRKYNGGEFKYLIHLNFYQLDQINAIS